MRNFKVAVLAVVLFLLSVNTVSAQAQNKKKQRKKEIYFSWGYNKEWYTKSTVKIDQPSLGNNFQLIKIKGHDHPGWDEGLFSKAISIPQYNYRLGLFINRQKGLAVEINFDHTKFIFADDQVVHMKGTVKGQTYENNVLFKKNDDVNADSSSYYYLNNGANFLLFNIVKRWHLLNNKKSTIQIDGLGKAGIGPVIPHVENKFFDQPGNTPDFQLGGWNIGIEGAVRATFFNYAYLEFANKFDYARYSGLKIYEGTAKHAFGTYEMILSLGLSFPVGKKMP